MFDLAGIRLTLLTGELLLVLLIPATMAENIERAGAVSGTSSYTSSQTLVLTFVAISASLILISLIIVAVGINHNSPKNTSYQILAHFLGVLLFGWFILDRLHYQTIWYIGVVFVLLPFICECGVTIVNLISFSKYTKTDE